VTVACVPVTVACGLFHAHNDGIHGGSSLLIFAPQFND
jgi:hypothetical protein